MPRLPSRFLANFAAAGIGLGAVLGQTGCKAWGERLEQTQRINDSVFIADRSINWENYNAYFRSVSGDIIPYREALDGQYRYRRNMYGYVSIDPGTQAGEVAITTIRGRGSERVSDRWTVYMTGPDAANFLDQLSVNGDAPPDKDFYERAAEIIRSAGGHVRPSHAGAPAPGHP